MLAHIRIMKHDRDQFPSYANTSFEVRLKLVSFKAIVKRLDAMVQSNRVSGFEDQDVPGMRSVQNSNKNLAARAISRSVIRWLNFQKLKVTF